MQSTARNRGARGRGAKSQTLLDHAIAIVERYRWYRSRYGEDAWELDAMDPNVLRARVEAAIRAYIDEAAWERMRVVEDAEQQTVRRVAAAMAGGSFCS